MNYYLNQNQQRNGDYEVHKTVGCSHPAESENQLPLGSFNDCFAAVAAAKAKYSGHAHLINGCFYCSNRCHTT